MSNEDLEFASVLVNSEIYDTVFELLSAAIDADEQAAIALLSDFQ